MLTVSSPEALCGAVAGGYVGYNFGCIHAMELPQHASFIIMRDTFRGALSGAVGAVVATDIINRIQ